MRYIRADEIFPPELLKKMQIYITRGLVYFPAPKDKRMRWGETSGEKNRIENRNNEIRGLFKSKQMNVASLAIQYNLSEETIKNIVYRR